MNKFEEGKAVVHCKNCHTNFAVPPECVPDKCPFCGKPINQKIMNNILFPFLKGV